MRDDCWSRLLSTQLECQIWFQVNAEVPFSVPAPIIILPSCPYVAATLTHAFFSHQLTLTSSSSPPPHHSTREALLKGSKPAESGASAWSQPFNCCQLSGSDGAAPKKLLHVRNGNASERETNKQIKREEVISVGLFLSPEKEKAPKHMCSTWSEWKQSLPGQITQPTATSSPISSQRITVVTVFS